MVLEQTLFDFVGYLELGLGILLVKEIFSVFGGATSNLAASEHGLKGMGKQIGDNFTRVISGEHGLEQKERITEQAAAVEEKLNHFKNDLETQLQRQEANRVVRLNQVKVLLNELGALTSEIVNIYQSSGQKALPSQLNNPMKTFSELKGKLVSELKVIIKLTAAERGPFQRLFAEMQQQRQGHVRELNLLKSEMGGWRDTAKRIPNFAADKVAGTVRQIEHQISDIENEILMQERETQTEEKDLLAEKQLQDAELKELKDIKNKADNLKIEYSKIVQIPQIIANFMAEIDLVIGQVGREEQVTAQLKQLNMVNEKFAKDTKLRIQVVNGLMNTFRKEVIDAEKRAGIKP